MDFRVVAVVVAVGVGVGVGVGVAVVVAVGVAVGVVVAVGVAVGVGVAVAVGVGVGVGRRVINDPSCPRRPTTAGPKAAVTAARNRWAGSVAGCAASRIPR